MAHPRKALVPVLLALFCLSPLVLDAQSSGSSSDLKDGIDLFRAGQFDKAILLFHNVILDPSSDSLKPTAYLLIAKSYMATGALDEAARNIEFYIATYPTQPDYPEALYQKGRLLFMQDDLESAIQSLQGFISQYPRSSFVSSAWFWAGESLYGLGRLDDALAIYQKVITDFPASAKVEAAQYKVSLIQLRKKEVELTKLLKWSHEDFLRSVEEYQNRERAYEQAIQSYQKRLTSSAPDDVQQTIAGLQKDLAAKTAEANRLAEQLAGAGAAGGSTAAAVPDQIERLHRLLAAQQKALELKEAYLAWLEANGGAGK
jgi:tetratricopeptide (TPR) repeat protein